MHAFRSAISAGSRATTAHDLGGDRKCGLARELARVELNERLRVVDVVDPFLEQTDRARGSFGRWRRRFGRAASSTMRLAPFRQRRSRDRRGDGCRPRLLRWRRLNGRKRTRATVRRGIARSHGGLSISRVNCGERPSTSDQSSAAGLRVARSRLPRPATAPSQLVRAAPYRTRPSRLDPRPTGRPSAA